MKRELKMTNATTKKKFRLFKLTGGAKSAIPMGLLFIVGFLGPLLIVLYYSFLPDRAFSYIDGFTLENYAHFFTRGYFKSFLWTFGLAFFATIISFIVSYPVAYGLARVFGRWAALITLFFVFPVFVSENLRLFGWILILLKGGGVIAGTVKMFTGLETGTLLYNWGAILLGLVYNYLPFTLFPMVLGISLVKTDQIEAASDLGANRFQIWREVELPIAMPGIMIGMLLTFVLAVGAIAEAKLLGGQSIIPIAHTIQQEFQYAQNWPLGSTIAMITIILVGSIAFYTLSKVDLDKLLGGR